MHAHTSVSQERVDAVSVIPACSCDLFQNCSSQPFPFSAVLHCAALAIIISSQVPLMWWQGRGGGGVGRLEHMGEEMESQRGFQQT